MKTEEGAHGLSRGITQQPNAIKLLLREIADFYCFFRWTSKSEKTIVFYAEHGNYYPYFEGIIEKLIGEHNQTLCYVTSSPTDPILQKSEPKIKIFYLDKLLPLFMALTDCRVFVITLTDLERFRLKRSTNPVHYVYVFHSLVSTHMVYRHGAFDHYDSILCCGPHHTNEIRKHEELNRLPRKKLIEAGYYRLERIYETYQEYSSKQPSSDTKKTILVAPSWGMGNILESCAERLVELLMEADYKVILRLHPEAVKRFPKLIALHASKFGDNPNFILETSIVTDDSLFKADALISDYSGIAFEYAFGTERPVLFLDAPLKVKNKRFKELGIEPLEVFLRAEIGVIVSPEKLGTVPQAISNLIVNKTAYKKRITELRKQYVYAFRHSSEIGAQHIIGLARGLR